MPQLEIKIQEDAIASKEEITEKCDVSPVKLAIRAFGQKTPILIKCPYCKKQEKTRTKWEVSSAQWMMCCILTFVGWPLPCLPCMVPQCYNTKHKCSQCNKYTCLTIEKYFKWKS